MGNFEKLVILTVLFLVATIFGISTQNEAMNSTDPLGQPFEENAEKLALQNGDGKLLSGLVDTNPGTKDSPVGSFEPAIADPKKASTGNANAKRLNQSGASNSGKGLIQGGNSSTRKSILISHDGLTESYGDDYMLYELEQGDTVTTLANRFYGDRKYKAMIRSDNEGKSLVAGTRIMLARYNFALEAGTRETFTPAPNHAAPKVKAAPSRKIAKAASYTVVDGDSLWKISLNVYGKGSNWGEIFKVNRDQMSDENDLKVGTVLRIPTL